MVEVNFSPAPSNGTTMSFARNCGSLATSLRLTHGAEGDVNAVEDLIPNADIGCEPKISSSIAVSCGRFCASLAGSENRGSIRISSRPNAFRTAGTLSGVATTKTNQVPSEERYVFNAAFAGCARSCSP